jgi:hypothetical protein
MSYLANALRAVLAGVGLAAWLACPASAATIGFDDVSAPELFETQDTQLTNQYAALGILFTPDPAVEDKNEILDYATFDVPPGGTSPNLLASRQLLSIDAMFTIPVFAVGAIIGVSEGIDRLSIFDAADNLLGTITGDDVFVSLNSLTPIARFSVTTEPGSTTPAIDNLTFGTVAEVSEPASLALFVAGAAGLALARRRKAA